MPTVLIPLLLLLLLKLQSAGLVVVAFFGLALFIDWKQGRIDRASLAPDSVEARAPLALSLLGAATPLAPLAGSGALLSLVLLYFVVCGRPSEWRWGAPYLVVLLSWALASLLVGFDPLHWAFVWREGGVSAVLATIRTAPPLFLQTLEASGRAGAFFLLTAHLSASRGRRDAFMRGLLVGLVPSAALSAYLIHEGIFCLTQAQQGFWSFTRRYCGSFTDPNAFGIAAALLLPLIAAHGIARTEARRFVSFLLLPVVVALGAYSGSRSFVLALLLYAVALLWALVGRSAVVLILGLGAAALSTINGWPDAARALLPIGFERAADTLTWGRIGDALFSKNIFWRLSFQAWSESPALGVGYGRFRSLVPVLSTDLGVDLHTWTDNANSFYLGVLAETGLVGAAGLLLSLASLRPRAGESFRWRRTLQVGLGSFGVLLLFGPHLDFDEVTVLASLLVASLFDVGPRVWPRRALCPAAAVVLAITVKTFGSDHGYFDWERDPSGEWYRWTTRRASSRVRCAEDGQSRSRLRAPLPGSLLPVKVTATGAGEQTSVVLTREGAGAEIALRCLPRSRFLLRLETSRPWIPGTHGAGADPRLLGVQVYAGRRPGAPEN